LLLLELNKSDLFERALSQAASLGTRGIYQKVERFFKRGEATKKPRSITRRG